MFEKLRVAVVGAGIYGRNHLNGFACYPYAELVAVCDLSAAVRQQVESEFGVRTYENLDELLQTEQIDAVAVATPDPFHKDPVLTAIRYHKHVLVEKPLATTSSDAREIIAAAEEAHVRVMVDYHKRWDPASIAVMNKLADPTSGVPLRGYMRMDDIIDVPTIWLAWADKSSPVHFLGTHCYDLIRWYMGCEVTEVYARGHKGVLKDMGIDTYDSVTAMLMFENGCTWTVENSWIVPNGFAKADDSCTHIMCEHALIRVDSQRRGVEFFDNDKGYTPNICFMQNNNGRLVGFGIDPMQDFVDCIRTGKPFIAGLKDGLHAELIAEAVTQSADTQQLITLNYDA
ncbi:Gfo/Idh/MocA family oxidoreductase [Collinsella sp. zg1085]|uniref:Gfo/Idh/MocA family protein n=1 Tax=Collinsella sp. zg1085 TaxID=2844380 RepID=UPI001C0E2F7A|nr:Gfo/Idh/MocA family oxidoreductase [Collinsella sp. zg1085]QWT17297.1 Gfo/Idh/MocA family oxidoreductase [Collinsella sp. zg1085]